jgi:hypothetical protein
MELILFAEMKVLTGILLESRLVQMLELAQVMMLGGIMLLRGFPQKNLYNAMATEFVIIPVCIFCLFFWH